MHPFCTTSLHSTLFFLALMSSIDSSSGETATMATANTTTKEGCPRQCGNITIPYPFGVVGVRTGCSLDPIYDVSCNTSYNPPKPFLIGNSSLLRIDLLEILDISETKLLIRSRVAFMCFDSSGKVTSPVDNYFSFMTLPPNSFSFSPTYNKLVVIGCKDDGNVFSNGGNVASSSCTSACSSKEEVVAGKCDGVGCCQASVPKGVRSVDVFLTSTFDTNNTDVASFNPCGYAFLAEEGQFRFGGVSDLNDPSFPSRVMETVPVAIDWVIGNRTCAEARLDQSSFACMDNTNCTDQLDSGIIGGYKCSCNSGFQGNPYLSPGCSDIDECAVPMLSDCTVACINTQGSFHCAACPPGHIGDGRNNGTGCTNNVVLDKSSQDFVLKLCLGISSGILLLVMSLSWLYVMDRKRKLIEMKKKLFEQNGGLLLKEQLSTANSIGNTEPTKIFTEEELMAATNNFDKDRILGTGGYGTVYKGVLPDDRVVAIKKSKVVDQNQIEQFINEVVILGQINHRNVVKLLGCCLETEVPLLVYEFISKGTLYSHIHESQNEDGHSWRLTWSDCLRIASEAADALGYLHSAASPPIIHRDIKSMNILLDDDYTAKIADFGASRLVPIDQTQLSTLVLGTLGYLDPEYLHSSLLTEKSDVYSFGVLLAELLTRQKPLSTFRVEEYRNLATYFVRSTEQEALFDILDPQWVSEASTWEIVSTASIAQRCLRVSGKDRPTMKEVSMELETIRKRKPRENQTHQETETSMMPHFYNTDVEYTETSISLGTERDLYPLIPR